MAQTTAGTAGRTTHAASPTPPARSGGSPSGPAGNAASITPRRWTSHLGVVHVLQLVAVEAVLLGVLAAAWFGRAALAGAAVAGVALIALVLTRRQGRWLLESLLLATRARRRSHRVPALAATDPRLATLRRLAPRLAVQDVDGPQDTRIGVGYDGEGWFAAAVVTANPAGDPAQVPPAVLARVLDRHRLPGGADAGPSVAAVQLVTLTDAVTQAHRFPAWPLTPAGPGHAPAPEPALAARTTWVAIRLDARPLAEADAGQESSSHAPPQLARMVRRMTRVLDGAGITIQVLDAGGLLDALARACTPGLVPPGAGHDSAAPDGPEPHEERAFWRCGQLDQATFWLQDWPPPQACPALLNDLSGAPAPATVVTLRIMAERAAEPGAAEVRSPEAVREDRFDVRLLVRVAAFPDDLDAACAAVTAAADAAGARLFRLDGEQAPAVYASAPTGGGPQ